MSFLDVVGLAASITLLVASVVLLITVCCWLIS